MTSLYIGLMSGTSVDAIDTALVRFSTSGIDLLSAREHPIAPSIKEQISAISHPAANEIERLGPLDRTLGSLFAEAVLALLKQANIQAKQVCAIGSHGQTIRHHPPSSLSAEQHAQAFTLQIGDPNTIAQLTGITTVADFRRRDICVGGEGAPLAPAFHAAMFATEGTRRAIVNIGGIANVTLLDGSGAACGFDTGPGNTLLDHWIGRHLNKHFDRGGRWAADGRTDEGLLEILLKHDYLHQRGGPRSTGKEAFNLSWLDEQLAALERPIQAQSVQATLAELSACTIANAIHDASFSVDEVYICGGGAHNTNLMHRLQQRLPSVSLNTTSVLGLHPDWVEAVAFAWLAQRTIEGLTGNLPTVTGASQATILGGIYPGGLADKPWRNG
ncbi:MAG: anhydro-N-acetylmuramic acid kinase [Parahaliea sp.]